MILYAVTIFVSAVLLFLVQPLIGKVILPWFGGSSAVWSTTLLFFQLLLLVGYLYSDVVIRSIKRRWQVLIHLGLVTASLLLMGVHLMDWATPITPGRSWAPLPTQSPLLQVLLTLTVSVGLPYLVLSTTSPLVQAWFAVRYPRKNPYPLYALSNVGSILALLAYPFLLEPALSTGGQAWVWSLGYLAFVVGLGAIAWSIRRRDGLQDLAEPEELPSRIAARRGPPLSWWKPVLWLALSMTGSVLLLGTTNQITQNVTAVPLLWVGPLAIYLVTFVIAFSDRQAYSRWTILLLFIATQIFGYVYLRGNIFPILVQLSTYGLLLFSACMVSHGELARLAPPPRHLTLFYLVLGLGGALGGVFVNLIAPAVFDNLWELPLAVLACWLFAGLAVAVDRQTALHDKRWQQLLVVGVFAVSIFSGADVLRRGVRSFYLATPVAVRNFYGVLRIQVAALGDPPREVYRMVHGTTIHGLQYAGPENRHAPLSYFGPHSGVGLAFQQLDGGGRRLGVLGLGVGTLAAYGEADDLVRFYEIDPAVIRYADGEGDYFDYLAATPAAVEVVLGDARLSLQQELDAGAPQAYDLLAVDVFSGDAPPVHLLTLEAFRLYLAHLADDGLLAVNISTTHLDLEPLLAGLARDLDLVGVSVADPGDGGALFRSRWVVLARDPRRLAGAPWDAHPDLQAAFDPELRVWTDDFSNLLQLLQ